MVVAVGGGGEREQAWRVEVRLGISRYKWGRIFLNLGFGGVGCREKYRHKQS